MEDKVFSLIDGAYSSKEAREILMNLYSDKVRFHEKKNFSSNECFGKDDLNAIKRIPQLKECQKNILELMKTAELENKKVIVTSFVEISFSDF